MSVIVKICGITNLGDAQAAAEAGANALGFMFYEDSPRCVSIETAEQIARQLPPSVVKVGVFVNPPQDLVLAAMAHCGLNILQFHGEETATFCRGFGMMTMKAFRIANAESLNAISGYDTDALLLDSYVSGQRGGTGATFNWDLAVEAKKFRKPIFLAGGLTPSNAAEAVSNVGPYGVDVSSGVESAPGKKDPQKIRDFIAAVRSVRAE